MSPLPKLCPVCGYVLNFAPYYEDGTASFEMCPCCGFQYGFDDGDQRHTFETYRQKWKEEGYGFFSIELCPLNWSKEVAIKQLENTLNLPYKPLIFF